VAGGPDTSIENPLAEAEHDATGEPGNDYAGDAEPEPPTGTAKAITGALSLLCGAWLGPPLTDDEQQRLTRDLVPVLAKYDVPNFRAGVEVQLVGTVVDVFAPRAVAKFQARKKAPEVHGDTAVPGKEGLGQERPTEEVGSGFPGGSESLDLVSGPATRV
jgi:hypothetical protein